MTGGTARRRRIAAACPQGGPDGTDKLLGRFENGARRQGFGASSGLTPLSMVDGFTFIIELKIPAE